MQDLFRTYQQNQQLLENSCKRTGNSILCRNYSNNKCTWVLREIVQKLGVLHYLVKLESGKTIKRHIDQLQKTKFTSNVKQETSMNTLSQEIPFNIPYRKTPAPHQEDMSERQNKDLDKAPAPHQQDMSKRQNKELSLPVEPDTAETSRSAESGTAETQVTIETNRLGKNIFATIHTSEKGTWIF